MNLATELMLEATKNSLTKAKEATLEESKRRHLKSAGQTLRAGLQEAFNLNDLMEGLGASVEARAKSFQMVIDGEI